MVNAPKLGISFLQKFYFDILYHKYRSAKISLSPIAYRFFSDMAGNNLFFLVPNFVKNPVYVCMGQMVTKEDTEIRHLKGGGLATAFQRLAPRLRRFLALRLKSDNDAQDLTQETYLRLMRVKTPNLIRQPEAYLFKIADNLANEFLLHQGKTQQTIDMDTLSKMGQDGDGDSFEQELDTRAAISRLEDILTELPPLYRAVLLLRKRDGLTHAEIAEKLQISQHTVHTYLKRAVANCRAHWTE